jgi:hypothetical protein
MRTADRLHSPRRREMFKKKDADRKSKELGRESKGLQTARCIRRAAEALFILSKLRDDYVQQPAPPTLSVIRGYGFCLNARISHPPHCQEVGQLYT